MTKQQSIKKNMSIIENPNVGTHMAEEHHHDQGEVKQQLWEKTGGNDLLKGRKSFQELYESLSDRDKAFAGPEVLREVSCMDEGDDGSGKEGVLKIGFGGAMIGYERAASDLANSGLKIVAVSSHEGCGAAALHAKAMGISDCDSDAVGDGAAQDLAERLEVPYSGRTSFEGMSRPRDLHIARVAYYDGTNRFVPSLTPGLPKGFLVTRGLISDRSYAVKLAQITVNIALGDHGFGVKFTPETPFYLVAVADNQEKLDELRVELEEIKNGNPRVKVETILRGVQDGKH